MWQLIQCAVEGPGHTAAGIPCQDKVFSLVRGDFAVACLADGAGSARLSHFGAEAVTRHLASLFDRQFDIFFANENAEEVKASIVREWLECLRKTAEKHACKLADLASTALVVAMKGERYILLHIGDGVIGFRRGGPFMTASAPSNGEFANTTVFTTSINAVQAVRLFKGSLNAKLDADGKVLKPAIDGFLLMSDGTEASFYEKRTQSFAPVVETLHALAQSRSPGKLSAMLEAEFRKTVREKTTDDCSFVLLARTIVPPICYSELDDNRKAALFGLSGTERNLQLERYDTIVRRLLERPEGADADEIALLLGLKKKHTAKYVDRLLERRLLWKNGRRLLSLID